MKIHKPYAGFDDQALVMDYRQVRELVLPTNEYTSLSVLIVLSILHEETEDYAYQIQSMDTRQLTDSIILGFKGDVDGFPGAGVPFFGIQNIVYGSRYKIDGSAVDVGYYRTKDISFYSRYLYTAQNDSSTNVTGEDGNSSATMRLSLYDNLAAPTDGMARPIRFTLTPANIGVNGAQTLNIQFSTSAPTTFPMGETAYTNEHLETLMSTAVNAGTSKTVAWRTDGGVALPLPKRFYMFWPFSRPRLAFHGFGVQITK